MVCSRYHSNYTHLPRTNHKERLCDCTACIANQTATIKIKLEKKKGVSAPHRTANASTHMSICLSIYPPSQSHNPDASTNQSTILPPPLPPRLVLFLAMRHILSNLRLAIPIDAPRTTLTPCATPRIQPRGAASARPLVPATHIRREG